MSSSLDKGCFSATWSPFARPNSQLPGSVCPALGNSIPISTFEPPTANLRLFGYLLLPFAWNYCFFNMVKCWLGQQGTVKRDGYRSVFQDNPGTKTKWRIQVQVVFRLKTKHPYTTLWSYFCSTPYRCAAYYEDTYTIYYNLFTDWANDSRTNFLPDKSANGAWTMAW